MKKGPQVELIKVTAEINKTKLKIKLPAETKVLYLE